MIFVIIFDIIYLIVWVFSIHMNPVKAVLVAGIAVLLTPWAKTTKLHSGRKIAIRIYAVDIYKKYRKK